MKPKNKKVFLSIEALEPILSKTRDLVAHLDSQINILLGISFAICLFSASQIKNDEWWVFFLSVAIVSGLASFIGLLAIHPPKFMRKRNQTESLFYNRRIIEFKTPNIYAKKIKEALGDEDKIIKQFSMEIYNLSKYYYRPKRKLFNLSRNVLFWGLALSLIAFLIDIIYKNFF